MAFFVAAISAWLLFSALTALRPGRRGIFAALAYPVGWAAGELPDQAIVAEAALVGLLWWWGWPHTEWLSDLVLALATFVVLENLVLVFIQFYSRGIVRRALRESPRAPLEMQYPKDDLFGAWWRTMLKIPLHPRGMQLIRNVPYGPEQRHRLDIWRTSQTPKGAPVIFFIHGGAWTFGDKREQGRPMLHEFVARGWVVVACNYRLAPKNPWPAQIEDVARTLLWIKKNIASYGGDPDRLVVAGGSAGGHLAALLALSSQDPTWRPRDVEGITDWTVRGCISLYGVLEMTGDDEHWRGLGKGLRILLEGRVVQRPFGDHRELYEQMSPHHRITCDAPPFLVIQGGNDTLVDVQVARNFVEKFRRVALARIYYVELPFTQHAFDVTASPRTSATTRAAVAFAESVVTPRPVFAPALGVSYQVPPTELRVHDATGAWMDARDAARELGSFFVVTSDNPYSQVLSDAENRARREELEYVLRSRGAEVRPSVASDPAGQWPVEMGFAVFDVSADFARTLARTFDQFAFYDVMPDGVRVLSSFDASAID
jgi:acetyl esterase/lipase